MENNNDSKGFQYTYSAKEQEELKRIREKYIAPTEAEDKMARLRRLDSGVTNKANVASLVCGIVGVLILGIGMSLCMSDFSEILGPYKDMSIIVGIIIGIIGGVITALAYPMHGFIVKTERKKIAPEIIRLTDELIK